MLAFRAFHIIRVYTALYFQEEENMKTAVTTKRHTSLDQTQLTPSCLDVTWWQQSAIAIGALRDALKNPLDSNGWSRVQARKSLYCSLVWCSK